ncbi:uncharacterized protein [Argopecten irradians]|uniref:uncharacterized protein n=1 Tax=Argopecten irradians TaxID=31199 RepID=UPI0037189C87
MMRLVFLLLGLCQAVWGHGRMMEPPQRSTVWRFYPGDSRFQPNYNDMELFCGGFQVSKYSRKEYKDKWIRHKLFHARPEFLDKHPLKFTNGESKWPVTYAGFYDLEVQLPPDMTCDQCVIQWHYKAGNNWGIDEATGNGCLGCGDQETFINCADVSISGTGSTSRPAPATTAGPTSATIAGPSTASSTSAPVTTQPTTPPTIDRCSDP